MDKQLYIIKNNQIKVSLTRLGASIYNIEIKEKNHFKSVLSTSQTIDDFLNDDMNKGRIIGRTAGKLFYDVIKNSSYFKEVSSDIMHGGPFNYAKSEFELIKQDKDEIMFKHIDLGILNGYVGNVTVFVTYKLEGMSLIIHVEAKSDHDTLVNITSHPYFNLSGENDISNHYLQVHAKIHNRRSQSDVFGSNYDVIKGYDDFRTYFKLEKSLEQGELDHVYVSDPNPLQASLKASNVLLNIYSNYPAIVIYTQNRNSHFKFNCNDQSSNKHSGIAIEPQYIQSSVPVLKKDKAYDHYIKYEFQII